jgi:cobalt/nickel transport system permease protein
MHIPDGFLDAKTWATLGVVSATAVGWAVKRAGKRMHEKGVPLMGVLAAFIFAAQMINFPIAGGTSGHFLGGVLAAILLGPSTGLLIMTTILIVQALIFQDGGLLALGANVFNMGLIGSVGGYYLYLIAERLIGWRLAALPAFIAGWSSIVLAAAACALELAVSGTVPLLLALPAMAGFHALIGIGEGLITVAVLGFISQVRPDLLKLQKV